MSKNSPIETWSDNNFTLKDVRDFWDKAAGVYQSVNEQIGDAHTQRFEESIKYLDLKPGQKVLNLWSRTGLAIPYLRRQCPEIEIANLEVSPEFIKIARQKFPAEKFQETDLEKLPFPDGYFDYILSLETLEHAPRPLVFLKELRRTLSPSGRLVLSLPPATAELPLRLYGFFFKNHGEGPHKFLSSKKVKKLLAAAGFKVLLHKGTLLIPAGPIWLRALGEKIIERFQQTPIRELGIRQFYLCQKTK